jgi:predicted RNA-binding protein with PIN domain
MPELIVDAMNVIGSRPDGWWRDREGAVRSLLARLQGLAAESGETVVLVSDGRPLEDVPEGDYDGVKMVYATKRGRDAADDRVVEVVKGLADASSAKVVTSDRDLSRRVRALGADAAGARSLWKRLDAIDAKAEPEPSSSEPSS